MERKQNFAGSDPNGMSESVNFMRRRQERLYQVMEDFAAEGTLAGFLKRLLLAASELTGSSNVSISLLDAKTGDLEVKLANPVVHVRLKEGEGITSKALADGTAQLVEDVTTAEWIPFYREFWPGMRAELAVPIILRNALVRVETHVERQPKPIGVLNLESPVVTAFSEDDRDLLSWLAGYAAVVIDRLENEERQRPLALEQANILQLKQPEQIADQAMDAIRRIYGYDFINISFIDHVRGADRIATRYVSGLGSPDLEVEFKRMANHVLNGPDIQCFVVENREPMAPRSDDERLDKDIVKRFQHEELARIYFPMWASNREILGTVEAAYAAGRYRRSIYEQDVVALQGFLAYVALAFEQRPRELGDRLRHEIINPIRLISERTEELRTRHSTLPTEMMELKLDDILTECEILWHQVGVLEYIIGLPPPEPVITETDVRRDVINATVKLMQPYIRDEDLDWTNVFVDQRRLARIPILYLDKSRLSQVFHNLYMNAIKYCERDKPDAFHIAIDVQDTDKDWLIMVRDWGIGILPDYEDKVFEYGFRAPQAEARSAKGSGLGLSIARDAMRAIGGDIKLTNLRKPTEFCIVLPRGLSRKPLQRNAVSEVASDRKRGGSE